VGERRNPGSGTFKRYRKSLGGKKKRSIISRKGTSHQGKTTYWRGLGRDRKEYRTGKERAGQ